MKRLVAAALVLALAPVTAPASAAAAEDTFRNGTGTATAQILRIAPGVGGLELATSLGSVASQVTNSLAQAKAQAIDLGIIGTTLTAEGCDGSPGALTPDQLPQSLVVDNRKGNASSTADEIPIGAEVLGGGRKSASATTEPSSEADVTGITSLIPGLVTISGGRAHTLTRVVDKNAREAVATSSLDIDIGGAVLLKNAQWRAVHRTGAKPAVDGTFSVIDGTAGGVPLPIEQMKPLQDAINLALAQTGITVELPRVEHITKPNDFLRVTPLIIQMKDSPLGHTVLGPVLNATREQREQAFNEIATRYCQAAGALLVGDITMNILSGTGFLKLEIGGVTATTADLELFNPFGSNDPFGEISEVLAGLNVPLDLPSLAATGAPPALQTGEAALVPVKNVCESVSRSKRLGCSRGSAWPVGIIGIALTAAIAAADWRRRRALAASTS